MSDSASGLPVVPSDAAMLPTVDAVAVRQGMFGPDKGGDTSGYGGLVQAFPIAPAAARPFGGEFDLIADRLEVALAGAGLGFESVVEKVVIHAGEITFFVRRAHLKSFAQVLRDEPALRFEMCTSVSGVHYPFEQDRELHAVYSFLSITHNRRIRVEVAAPDADPHIPSLTAIYPGTNWHERETYDFFGIIFDDHPALTRIEMPDDWPGHPQRKDYPLGGIPVEYKGATIPAPDQRRSYH